MFENSHEKLKFLKNLFVYNLCVNVIKEILKKIKAKLFMEELKSKKYSELIALKDQLVFKKLSGKFTHNIPTTVILSPQKSLYEKKLLIGENLKNSPQGNDFKLRVMIMFFFLF
jgi:hypothetical protein